MRLQKSDYNPNNVVNWKHDMVKRNKETQIGRDAKQLNVVERVTSQFNISNKVKSKKISARNRTKITLSNGINSIGEFYMEIVLMLHSTIKLKLDLREIKMAILSMALIVNPVM